MTYLPNIELKTGGKGKVLINTEGEKSYFLLGHYLSPFAYYIMLIVLLRGGEIVSKGGDRTKDKRTKKNRMLKNGILKPCTVLPQ